MAGFVYILTNHKRSTFYIGVTDNLRARLHQHQQGQGSIFTARYKLSILIYFEQYPAIAEAIIREKQLKNWRRDKKLRLIKQVNPQMNDLSVELMML